MNRICNIGIQCALFPGEVDSPVLNVSSEAPDADLFYSILYPPDPIECLGCNPQTVYKALDCIGVVFSADSQAAADQLARLSTAICKQPHSQEFTNDPQTATASCPGGTSVFSYTVPAGTMTVASDPDPQAWIAASNAAALAYAQQQASDLAEKCCLTSDSSNNLNPHPGWMCLGEELLNNTANVYEVTGTNSGGDWVFNIIGGALPPGVTLDKTGSNTAQLSGLPAFAGVYTYTIEAIRPASPNTSITITDTLAVFGVTNSPLPDAFVGIGYSAQLLTAGGSAPVTFTADPLELPVWLTIDDSGLLIGTPLITDVGIDSFPVTITDADGKQCVQTVELEVEAFNCITNSDSLPDAPVGVAYSQTLVSSFGTGPRAFTTTDSLPAGLTLHSSGLIDGTPTTPGTVSFTVKVTDSLLAECTDLCSIKVTAGVCPDWSTLTWKDAVIDGGSGALGGGSFLFTPNNSASDSFHANANAPSPGFPNNDAAGCQNFATIFGYTGGECHCNLHLVVTGTTDFACQSAYITGPTGFLFDVGISGLGTFDIPFTIPDTGGVPTDLNIQVTLNMPVCVSPPAGIQETIDFVGTFSNVP